MEELKLLIDMVARLPQTALWVLIGFWAYKVIVIGSIFGVIRYAIWALHSWMTKPKYEMVEVRLLLHGVALNDTTKEALLGQLERVRRHTGVYVHPSDVDWLRQAIDDRIAKDEAK